MKIVLASMSPRRKEMMLWLGVPFTAVAPDIDESSIRGDDPVALTQLLAQAKAEAVAMDLKDGVVIGSDAVVSFNNQILEKARDSQHQRELINMQKGQIAQSVSSVCIINAEDGQKVVETRVTRYKVSNPPDHVVEAYISSGKGLDKAGGFGLQDENGFLLDELYGCYTNLIGFPLCAVAEILQNMGIKIEVDIKQEVEKRTGRKC